MVTEGKRAHKKKLSQTTFAQVIFAVSVRIAGRFECIAWLRQLPACVAQLLMKHPLTHMLCSRGLVFDFVERCGSCLPYCPALFRSHSRAVKIKREAPVQPDNRPRMIAPYLFPYYSRTPVSSATPWSSAAPQLSGRQRLKL